MPDPKKIRWAQLRVGLVALVSFIIVAYLIFLLTSSHGLFQSFALLRTYMEDAGGIADGSVVQLNGITAGYLDKLQLSNSGDPKRTVEFDMMVKEKYLRHIPVDSLVGISAA